MSHIRPSRHWDNQSAVIMLIFPVRVIGCVLNESVLEMDGQACFSNKSDCAYALVSDMLCRWTYKTVQGLVLKPTVNFSIPCLGIRHALQVNLQDRARPSSKANSELQRSMPWYQTCFAGTLVRSSSKDNTEIKCSYAMAVTWECSRVHMAHLHEWHTSMVKQHIKATSHDIRSCHTDESEGRGLSHKFS